MEKNPEGKNALRAATGIFTGGCSPCRASARKTDLLKRSRRSVPELPFLPFLFSTAPCTRPRGQARWPRATWESASQLDRHARVEDVALPVGGVLAVDLHLPRLDQLVDLEQDLLQAPARIVLPAWQVLGR